MSITAKELARKLNLSEAAVSIALNNKPGVSTATRQLVLEAAEKYGYDFTRISGKQRQTGTIVFAIFQKHGAVVSDTPFFTELRESIQNTCRELGCRLTIQYLYDDDELTDKIDDIVYSDCVGILLQGTEMHREDFRPFERIRLPIVLLDVYLSSIKRDCVLINNEQGAYLAADHLIRRRKQQPGYLRSSYSICNFDERADGFYQAIRKHGYPVSQSIVHRLSPSIDGAYADMLELLKSGEHVGGCYFADNDNIAIGAMRAFREMGYRIPEDVAIVGFDNIPMCNYTEPALTTVNVPRHYLGEVAVRRLLEVQQAKQFVPLKIEVDTNLVKRRSV